MAHLASFSSAAFSTASGLAVSANATVEVRRESDGALAAIFSDRAGTAGISQPGFVADSSGRFTFYAAWIDEGYQVTVSDVGSPGGSHTLNNILDLGPMGAQIADADTAAEARAALGFPTGLTTPVDAEIPIGDGTNFISVPVPMGFSLLNGYLDWTVAGNVLTVAVKTWAGADPTAADPVYIAFRDATAATGLPLIRKLTAATSISINDTATLGTINSTAFRLWCVAFDDGGTVRLALINCLSGTAPSLNIFTLAGWGIASSTLEDNASDSAHVFYSDGAAVTSKAYAVVGYATWESGLATAGTWSAGPTRKQMFGPSVPLPGQLIQVAQSITGAVATGTTLIPLDDTIPQNTEGTEFMTQAITPQSTANLLDIEHQGYYAGTTGDSHSHVALFQDSTANALAATIAPRNANATTRGLGRLLHVMRAGTVSSTTFKVRASTVAAGTVTFNGSAGAREFGGVINSYLRVQELMG